MSEWQLIDHHILFLFFLVKLACLLLNTLEQLLEVTARAVQPVLEWGESGLAIADGLSNLLKVYVLSE